MIGSKNCNSVVLFWLWAKRAITNFCFFFTSISFYFYLSCFIQVLDETSVFQYTVRVQNRNFHQNGIFLRSFYRSHYRVLLKIGIPYVWQKIRPMMICVFFYLNFFLYEWKSSPPKKNPNVTGYNFWRCPVKKKTIRISRSYFIRWSDTQTGNEMKTFEHLRSV